MDTWLAAFPIREANDAVSALCESWGVLAAVRRPDFHPGVREPLLTRVLKTHVEQVTSRKYGILGMWATEAVYNEIDSHTGAITEEHRTDIVYGWNNEYVAMRLVFEFKKLNSRASSRRHYLEKDGLGRFVTGTYSRSQPVAVMVGILAEPKAAVVQPLLREFRESKRIASLRIQLTASGDPCHRPSLISKAEFDTEHERDSRLAPSHGTIRVAHLFLLFRYGIP